MGSMGLMDSHGNGNREASSREWELECERLDGNGRE